jgi:cytochrome P450
MVLPYNDRLKEMRRLFRRSIGTKSSLAAYAQAQEAETHRFLRRVLDEPNRLQFHIRKLAGAIVLMVSHGYQVKEGNDDFVDFAEDLMSEFAYAVAPGNFAVDAVPALDYLPNWFPGTGYRDIAKKLGKRRTDFLNIPHERVRAQLAAGTAKPSFVASNIDRADITPEQDDIIKWAAAAMYGGGADTTTGTIYNFVLCMILYPEVQARAQQELDTIIGTDRLPNLSDRGSLPYTEALIKEVLRWGQVVPGGVPHASAEDDVHRGYFLPKGSVMIPNIWLFTHDERTYARPNEFNPDRFLGPNPEKDPRAYVFGFGRRVCPGQQLAEATTFIACASILASLQLSKARDADGNEITPKPNWSGDIVTHLDEFPCVVKPRSAKAEALARESSAAAGAV